MSEEEVSESLAQEEKQAMEEVSESYYEETEVEYIAFSPQELEQFLTRSETWDRIAKGEISLNEAKSILESQQKSAGQRKATPSRGKKRRRRSS
uniref:RNA polymerase Rpo13 subunit HTH domain-containing protein n=1 Tax=Ignisphaera aggregans TaxID=334771 RepID=A0A7J2U190_9CREN